LAHPHANSVQGTLLSDQSWLNSLAQAQPRIAKILSASQEQQKHAGYSHTLHEIFQQPSTWLITAERMITACNELSSFLSDSETVVLTGSGSSEFVGHCVRAPLQHDLGTLVEVISGGNLLAYGSQVLPPVRPGVVVSVGRSGDSPESVGAVERLLHSDANIQHLFITCNRQGALATNFCGRENVQVIALDDATNDRSLVMTSSFTNLTLAARFLGFLKAPDRYRLLCEKLSPIAEKLLRDYCGALGSVAHQGFKRVVFLGNSSRLGAARESALKVLEMTAGAVPSLYESYLGLRHGPMSFVDSETLIVCFLSSDTVLRAYESDLIRELDQKKLGMRKVVVGENIPRDLISGKDTAVECPGLGSICDDDTPVIHVIVGQLLGFFRCLEEGLHPDAPSKSGVITRVVPGFKLHFSASNNHDGHES
jgi:tagatose-6-phosphate ketose/aldose isomerase